MTARKRGLRGKGCRSRLRFKFTLSEVEGLASRKLFRAGNNKDKKGDTLDPPTQLRVTEKMLA